MHDLIFGTISDLVADFLYYDRKNDEDLPVGEIQRAIEAGEVTIEEIVRAFETDIKIGLGLSHEGA